MKSCLYSRRTQQGLTMVELMVAMTLGLLITAAVLQIFIGAKRNYEFQSEFARVQENGRFAMQFLTKAIRQADFWGCLKNNTSVTSILNPASGPIGSVGTVGFESTDEGSPYTPAVGPKPDRFTVRGGTGGGISLKQPPATVQATQSTILVDKLSHPAGGEIQPGDILMVSDCTKAVVFQVTGTNTSTNSVQHNSGGSWTPGNGTASGGVPGGLGSSFSTDESMIFSASSMQFWIRQGISGEPTLVRGTEFDALTGGVELVEGIENMQLLLGYDDDTPGDGVADYYAPPPPAGSGDMNKVVAVQVSLVARSLSGRVTDGGVPLEYNDTTYTTASSDRYLRKVFTTNVTIRNRVN